MDLDRIVTIYGNLIGLALLAIAYFFKRGIDSKDRKIEANSNFFQERKLVALEEFFDSYNEAERMWHGFPHRMINDITIDPKELDSYIWPSLNSVKRALVKVTIYFDERETKIFEQVYDSLLEINNLLLHAYGMNQNDRKSIISKFEYSRMDDLEKNDTLLKEIATITRDQLVKAKIQ